MRAKSFLISSIASLLLVGAGCSLLGAGQSATLKPVTITYWRSDADPASAFQPIIDAYRNVHPNVTVVYRAIPNAEYEKTLLEALAVDQGPDIFSVPVTSLASWRGKLLPMPEKTTIATQVVNDKKQIVVVNQESRTLTATDIRNRFVDGVFQDMVVSEFDRSTGTTKQSILGLPLSFDTLALLSNARLLKGGGYTEPPKGWRELQEAAPRLTVKKADGTLAQSGAALGIGSNVRNAADIAALLMRQNGGEVTDASSFAVFQKNAWISTTGEFSNVEAMQFYEGFADEVNSSYSWNATMPNSLDAFVTGRVAMMLGYPEDAAAIRTRAPGLDLTVSALPQIEPARPKNIARYRTEMVSRKSKNPDIAWDFLIFASSPDQMGPWLTQTKRPTALRSLIASQLTDKNIAPFVGTVLTAKSWYRGANWNAAEAAMAEMLDKRPAPEDDGNLLPFMSLAADAINRTIQP